MLKKESFSLNTISNILYSLINLGVLVWFTPYLVNKLGVEAYGYIPLITNFIGYFSLFTTVFNSMVSRFITVELRRGNVILANKYFNTSVLVSIVFIIFSVPIIIICTLFINKVLKVSDNYLLSIQILFIMTGINLIVATIKTPISTATYYSNRFDIRNLIAIVELLVRVSSIFLLFCIFDPALEMVGASYLLSAIVGLIMSAIVAKNLMPDIKLNFKNRSYKEFKTLVSSGLWVTVDQIGYILIVQLDLLIVNLVLGPVAVGKYALTTTFPNLLRSLNSTISSVFGPTITRLYAENDNKQLLNYIKRTVSIMSVFMSLPIGILIGMGDKIISLWIGHAYQDQYLLLIIMSVPLAIGLPITALGMVFTAFNKVKYPALITCTFGVLHLVMAFMLVQSPLGIYGVGLSSGISLLLKNSIFYPIYAARQIGYKWWVFYVAIKDSVFATSLVVIISLILKQLNDFNSWFSIIIYCIIVSVTYIFYCYFIIFNMDDRKRIIGVLINR